MHLDNFIDFLQFCLFSVHSFHIWFIFHGSTKQYRCSGFHKTLFQLLKVNLSVWILVCVCVYMCFNFSSKQRKIKLNSWRLLDKASQFSYTRLLLATYHYEKYSVYVSTYYVAFMMMTLPMQWNFKHGKVFEILPPTLKLTGHQWKRKTARREIIWFWCGENNADAPNRHWKYKLWNVWKPSSWCMCIIAD